MEVVVTMNVVDTTTTIAPISVVAKSDLASGVLDAPAVGGLLVISSSFHI